MQQVYRALATVQDWLRVWWLCPRGHAALLVITATRMYSECAICGEQSRGWDIELGGTIRIGDPA